MSASVSSRRHYANHRDAVRRYQAARRRARHLGLQVRMSGSVWRILDDQGAQLFTGTECAVFGWLDTKVANSPRRWGRRLEVPAAWVKPIEDYLTTLAARGQRAETLTLRRSCLARMARELDCAPQNVTAAVLIDWFGRQQQWQIETRRSHRASARGFFTWAYRTKLVPDYLGDELPKVGLPHTAARPAPDQVWRLALSAADPRTTVMLRLAAELGLRRGEVARVHTRDLMEGVNGAQLLVHGKGGKQRVIPISGSLAELVRAGAAGPIRRVCRRRAGCSLAPRAVI